jgi:hypothetical protein
LPLEDDPGSARFIRKVDHDFRMTMVDDRTQYLGGISRYRGQVTHC